MEREPYVVAKCIRFLAYFMHVDVREKECERLLSTHRFVGNHLDIDDVRVYFVQFRKI